MIKFDIVIPSYKRTDVLLRAVNSVCVQGEFVGKIIIIDDASPNQAEIAELLAAQNNERIIFVANTRKSNAAQTRNQGARIATSDWVSFLDSDDIFLEGKFSALEQAISLNPTSDVFYNRAMTYFDGMPDGIVPDRFLEAEETISEYLFVSKMIMQTSTLTIKRSFFDKYGFNENYTRHQDFDLCLTLEETGCCFTGVDCIGTAIFWGADERPADKGESMEYSKNWLSENSNRMTSTAIKAFLIDFVAVKALRQGNKKLAIKELYKIGFASIGLKKLLVVLCLFLLPHTFYFKSYVLYKHAKCYLYGLRKYRLQ